MWTHLHRASLLLAISLTCAPALADTPAHIEDENLAGLKLTTLTSLQGHDEPTALGSTLFYERTLIHHWLELEVAVAGLFNAEHAVWPLDLIAKTPLGFSHLNLEPYLGFGPTLDLVMGEHESHWYPGLVATAGGYFWFSDHLGVDLDLAYSLLFEEHNVHELLTSAGLVAHF
jgi:hypothetical protein